MSGTRFVFGFPQLALHRWNAKAAAAWVSSSKDRAASFPCQGDVLRFEEYCQTETSFRALTVIAVIAVGLDIVQLRQLLQVLQVQVPRILKAQPKAPKAVGYCRVFRETSDFTILNMPNAETLGQRRVSGVVIQTYLLSPQKT